VNRIVALLLLLGGHASADGMKGISLALYPGPPDSPRHDYPALVDEIAGVGADHISLAVFWRQDDVRSTTISRDEATTISDERLRAAVRAAHRRGLKVLLFPIVEVTRRKDGEWRGTLAPSDVAAWWASYEGFVMHYAAIAAEEKVALLCVGSELGSTETWQERWLHLIRAIRRSYPGQLLYSANWDHHQAVTFWAELDFMGVNAYFALAGKTEAELARSWAPSRDGLLAAAKRAGKPLVITEVGYQSRAGAAARPWDYGGDAKVDLEEQRRLYAAFDAAWRDAPLAGVFWWNWWGEGGATDTGYTPRGKPAEKVLRAIWRR
jgi:hypothetical protein